MVYLIFDMCFNKFITYYISVLLIVTVVYNRPIKCGPANFTKSWPYMKNHDIWGRSSINLQKNFNKTIISNNNNNNNNNNDNNNNSNNNDNNNNDKNTLHLYNQNARLRDPKVDDECISDDGRRSGICLNVYECRIQGGTSRGQCALGFGVCCVFTATCDQEIFNNITYFISPSFPAIMSSDVKSCKIKIKMISPDISQLRLDFIHFSLGQPNRMTGYCDGDLLSITGGTIGDFNLCGHNNGQHVYYDVPGNTSAMVKGRQNVATDINLFMNFTNSIFQNRLWEVKVTQIPFSQRAPTGCLQYYFGTEGIIQTFNFAVNGRHLANQDYRACVRQETGMCSIAYEPCDDQSFRIGPNQDIAMDGGGGVADFGGGGGGVGTGTGDNVPITNGINTLAGNDLVSEASVADTNNVLNDVEPVASEQVTEVLQPSSTLADEETIEGSGGGVDAADNFNIFPGFFSSISSFFSRNFYQEQKSRFQRQQRQRQRQSRQFTSTCTDRITMPCIVEDFIAAGMGTVIDCSPIHCGSQFCLNGILPCRIESTVTPFHLGIHFGDGKNKGSPEDNIGACLKYNQVPCVV